MENTWIMIANSSDAFIYILDQEQFDKGKIKIDLIASYNHPESRQKDSDLISDRSGHYVSRNLGHGSFNNPTDPKDHEAEVFAKQLADELETARNTNQFRHLILITPSNFQGLFNKHVKKNVSNLIIKKIDKDYTKAPKKQLLDHLKIQLLNSDKQAT